jgi:hypothetical protein
VLVSVRRNADAERFTSSSTFDSDEPIESVRFTIPTPVASYRHRSISVFDPASGAAVDGISIVADWTGRVLALTDTSGMASLEALPSGKINLSTRRQGYDPRVFSVTVDPTDTSRLTLSIARAKKPYKAFHCTRGRMRETLLSIPT